MTLIFAIACFDSGERNSSEEEEKEEQEREQEDGRTAENNSDGGVDDDENGSDPKNDESEEEDDNGDSKPQKADAGGAEDSVRCEDDGYCYYPDGHFCDPYGMCCYPDGRCVEEEVDGGTGGSSGDPFDMFGPRDGSPIDPSDMTDEPWKPPIDDLAESLYGNSTETLCTGYQTEVYAHSVWSDSRGVFVLASGYRNGEYHYEYPESEDEVTDGPFYPGMEICVGEGCPTGKIFFNNGNGWDVVFEQEQMMENGPMDSRLTGFENGPLVMYGYDEIFTGDDYIGCGLSTIENGNRKCEPVYWVDHVFIVNDDLAYGLFEGDMIIYEDGFWGPMPGTMMSISMHELWANETHIFGLMDGGRIVMMHDGDWESLNTRTLNTFSSIWGFSETDVWAGTYEGAELYHFDGGVWNEIDWEGDGCGTQSSIRGMWGSNGVLYFHTETAIGKVVDSEVEILAAFPCPDYDLSYEEQTEIVSLWGNRPDDVYFLIRDGGFPRRECGIIYLLHYDGNEFHQI